MRIALAKPGCDKPLARVGHQAYLLPLRRQLDPAGAVLGHGQDVREGAAHGGAQHVRLLHGLGVPGGRHPGLLPAQGLGRLQHLQNARPLVSVAPAAWYWCVPCLMMLGLMMLSLWVIGGKGSRTHPSPCASHEQHHVRCPDLLT